ncbi:MAG: glucosaminidase domain-containing protein [Chromatiales bacterium]|nr:glucosaminidase domain-containing protein [Chromatiales bacterium]
MSQTTPRGLSDWQTMLATVPALLLPVLLALWLATQWGWRDESSSLASTNLLTVEVSSSRALAALFAEHDYHWPPAERVPALALRAFPADLGEQPINKKKRLFFQSLLPLVLAENARLQKKREWLLGLDSRRPLSAEDAEQLGALRERYKLTATDDAEQDIANLLRHIDKVPVALVLAQAANESGWGSSRFAQQANNLFGEWTWRAEEGIAPLVRNEGSRHYVRRFDSLADSVRAYIYNLNAGHAYADLRRMRAEMRARGAERFDALSLATGLERYSARGEEYVAEIQQMIRGNRLQQLGSLELEH